MKQRVVNTITTFKPTANEKVVNIKYRQLKLRTPKGNRGSTASTLATDFTSWLMKDNEHGLLIHKMHFLI